MEIHQYAVEAESIDALSKYQITSFFSQKKSITKDDCDKIATKITGDLVSPTLVQGVESYTVAADTPQHPKVVQFRNSPLHLELVKLARQTYRGFVPRCIFYDKLDDVYVYEMDLVPGVALSRAMRKLLAPGMETCLLQTVRDFARLFASAWINRPVHQLPATDALFNHYRQILDQLSQGLPSRFHAKLSEVRQGLPLLFRPTYPMIVNHDDLFEMNIHVDEESGGITGIVDWADAKIAPFGTSLGGLETLLGVRTSSRWHFHPLHNTFREQFWKEFYETIGYVSDEDRRAIEIVRMFGLFRTHGFDRRPEKPGAMPLAEREEGFVYLEAFCLPPADLPGGLKRAVQKGCNGDIKGI
ncbi:hypothetical protein F4774DRAFT_428645 [Daldinia eschscholtzii]|nr:hypothetical protein F4774DRAFT_428645 [Daldinia eschscholtzii]